MERSRRAAAEATYLRAKLGDQVRDCLLDTGSDVTLIFASVVKDAEIIETTHVQQLTAPELLFWVKLHYYSAWASTKLLYQVWCRNTWLM